MSNTSLCSCWRLQNQHNPLSYARPGFWSHVHVPLRHAPSHVFVCNCTRNCLPPGNLNQVPCMRPVWLNVISSCIPNELLQMLLHKIHRSLFALCWQRVIMPELQASCPCAAVGSILAACLSWIFLLRNRSQAGTLALALQMVQKASAFRDAPPTRNPSTSFLLASSAAFWSFTEPPVSWWIGP